MKNSFKKKVLATGLTAAMTVAAITGCSKGAEGGAGAAGASAGFGLPEPGQFGLHQRVWAFRGESGGVPQLQVDHEKDRPGGHEIPRFAPYLRGQ